MRCWWGLSIDTCRWGTNGAWELNGAERRGLDGFGEVVGLVKENWGWNRWNRISFGAEQKLQQKTV